MMKVLKNIINKYMPLSLGTLVALVMMGNVISCNSCRNDKEDNSGTLAITANKEELKGKDDCDVEIIVKGTKAGKGVIISNFKMRVIIQREGGIAGESQVSYTHTDQTGVTNDVVIKDNEAPESKELGHFFNLDGKTNLSDTEELKSIFTFKSGPQVTKLTVIFELLDQDNNPVDRPCPITWEAEAAATYELAIEGLEGDNTVAAINKFTIKVKKDGGDIVSEEATDFKVVVTTTGDATIDGGNTISFAGTDIKAGIIEKEIKVIPGAEESEFKLQLEYNGVKVGAVRPVKVKALAAGSFTLAVDKSDIEDGSTDFKVTVSGGKELEEADLEKLTLKIETTEDAKIDGVVGDKLAFRDAHKLTIDAANKKQATKTLTIVPGADKKAKLKLTLLDEKGNAIGGTAKTVAWSNGIELEVKLGYDATDQKVTYKIEKKGKSKATEFQLFWKGAPGKNVQLDGKKEGDILVQLDGNTKTKSGDLLVDWAGDKYGEFKFMVKYQGVEESTKTLSFAANPPKVTIALAAAKTTFKGNGEKTVTFVITAVEDLIEADLDVAKVAYTAEGGYGKLLHATVGEANDKSLHELLGIASLGKGKTTDLVLTIDHAKKSKVTFTDIKLKGSDKEDDAGNKVAQIDWVGEIKVKVKGRVELSQLKGDGGKTVPLRFTNESGFDLVRIDLEKVIINLNTVADLPLEAFINYGSDNIKNGTTTLWDILQTNLDASTTYVDKDLTIVSGRNRKVDFTLTLAGENGLTANHEVDVVWEGEIKVKVERREYTGEVKGVAGKIVPLIVTNQSGFKLEESDLKKIVVKLIGLTVGASVNTNTTDAIHTINPIKNDGTTTLWDILNYTLDANGINAYGYPNLIIVPGTNKSVGFTLTLGGENKADIAHNHVTVNWQAGEIKVKVEGYNPKSGESVDLAKLSGEAGKIVPLRFINESGFDLVQEELEKIVVQLNGLAAGVSLHDETSFQDIISESTTLWSIIDDDLTVDKPFNTKLNIDNDGQEKVDFTLTLAGENKETTNNKVYIKWEKGAEKPIVLIKNAYDPIFIKGGIKTFELEFWNDGEDLNAEDLDKIKVEIAGKDKNTKITFNNGTNKVGLISGKTTLKELLQVSRLRNTEGASGYLMLDSGTASALNFTIRITGSDSPNVERIIEWKEVKVMIDTTKVELNGGLSDADKSFDFKITNKSGFTLTWEDLQNIIIQVDGELRGNDSKGSDYFDVNYKPYGYGRLLPINSKSLRDLLQNKDFQIDELQDGEEETIPLYLWKGDKITEVEGEFTIRLQNVGTNEEKKISWKKAE